MPISRGKSIMKSRWIRDMGEFYGDNIFLAETSATSGGLDSLLQPHGTIKQAQEKAARAFGANKTYFVTNGTSTANKIVVQALMSPGEIALVSRDCHKSHHYALVLAGSMPVYMDPYPLQKYSIYGAVPLKQIKRYLLELREAGELDRVRMLLLTNCTFDGIVYRPEQVMLEVLAIKPDMIFVWDEAWFGFARFSPTYRQRTAMEAASRLHKLFDDPTYRERYQEWKADFNKKDTSYPETWVETTLLPDPEAARIRVYATQSTHKTLTSFRQGSMIHVHDQDFGRLVQEAFDEAYMTHTSTSPNYQILASLDVGRRQVELEGCELVEQSVALAMTLSTTPSAR
jgi:arginine decarboxylase